MYIFADNKGSIRTGRRSPHEFDIDLPVPVHMGAKSWYLAILETSIRSSATKTQRIHISANCVGSSILNGESTSLLRSITINARKNPHTAHNEFTNVYRFKVNQPVLTGIRISLTKPDGGAVDGLERVHCVLSLTSEDE